MFAKKASPTLKLHAELVGDNVTLSHGGRVSNIGIRHVVDIQAPGGRVYDGNVAEVERSRRGGALAGSIQ